MGQPVVDSATLLNAEIGFLDTRVVIIHIPLHVYPVFVQSIVRLLVHNSRVNEDGHAVRPSRPWQFWHPFVHVSLTPDECSVICPRDEADELFRSAVDTVDPALRKSVTISPDDYSVIMIGGEGLEAGQRVLDLTSPLALAGIPILFITSYWSDFILVPQNARARVIHTLEDRGFVFEAGAGGQAGQMTNPSSPLLHPHRKTSSMSFDFAPGLGTPPPANVSELQDKTFTTLSRHGIVPRVDRSIQLVTCAGIKETTTAAAVSNLTEVKLQLGFVKCLTTSPPPSFFSLILTDTESASLALETRLLPFFHNDGEDLLLGKDGPEQVHITFDLKDLPLESTGIVCGVANRLINGMKGRIGREMFNMSYLSTAKAGHVILYEDELDDALEALHDTQYNGSSGFFDRNA